MSQDEGLDLGDLSLLDLFRQEVESHTAVLNEGLLELERDPGAQEPLDALMRAAHSIKGAALIVQLDAVVTLAHAMEDCLVAVRDGGITLTAAHVDVLLRATDMLVGVSKIAQSDLGSSMGERGEAMAALAQEIAGLPDADVGEASEEAGEGPVKAPDGERDGAFDALADLSLMALFRQEVESHSVVLSEGLLALESDPTSTDSLESLMRAAHSVKGAARIVQLDPVVTLAHAMEDCFVATQDGKVVLTSECIDVLLQAADLLVGVAKVEDSEATSWLGGRSGEFAQLGEAITGIASGKPHLAAADVRRAEPEPPAEGTLPSAEPAEDGAAAGKAEPALADRVVRVTAANLDRLMGLTGECLVESGWLRPFSESLLRLKATQAKATAKVAKGAQILGDAEAELTDAQQGLGQCREILSDCLNEFESFSRRLGNLTERLYQEVIASRMRPFADGAQGFPRLVRDLARKLGKKVRLEIHGKGTDVDRDILDKLEAPLNHIMRNSVDHGIENPDDRAAAGKPPEGSVRLEARHRAGMLCVTVSDDGKGIDVEGLRAKVVRKELATAEMAAQMCKDELLEFMFLPGFSTAKEVTEVSGRGVGLDVVQSMVQEVAGTVRVESEAGQGTTFHLQLPITLSVIRTLLTEIGGEPYAFPLTRIDRILMLERDQIETLEGRQYFAMDGENVGLISACQVLETGAPDGSDGELPVMVISDRLNRYGIAVDRLLGERDLVVRPLDQRLGKVKDISATALMEDGSPLLIVDVDDMVRSIDSLLSGGRLAKVSSGAEGSSSQRRKRVLVVDDSLTVREVERKLLENNGYEVEVAVDGMDGWNAVRTGKYDLVISDVDMPRMNGIELVTRLRQDPDLRDLPVMIVSYKDREEDRLRGLDAGANYYFTKSSFHDEALVNAVIDLIGRPLS